MSDVADFGAYRDKRDAVAHSQGPARCLHCKHTWQACAPVGTFTLDCPACGMEKGVFAWPFRETGYSWQCKCDNDLFMLTPHGALCIKCGLRYAYEDLGDG